MALRCETCGADNPATNRYCGQCGKELERTAMDPPEEFWRGGSGQHPVGHEEAAADLPPEVIAFDNQIPIIASDGSDRRHLPPSPKMVGQVHDHLEQEAALHNRLHHGSEPHFEVLAKQEAESAPVRESRSDYLRWDTNDNGAENTSKDKNKNADAMQNRDRPSPGKALGGAAAEPSAAQPLGHRNFLPEGERTRGTGVSGPSFLGLTDDQVPEYDDEEREPDSHLRRNLALAILVAALILAAVQWRSIRDYGLAYVQNGSMQVKQRLKGAPQNPPAVAADNTSRDLGLPPATTKPGAPVAVESSPNADRALPAEPVASDSESKPGTPVSPSGADTKQPPARSATGADVPKNEVPKNDVPKKNVVPPSKQPAVVSHSAAKPRAVPQPPAARSVSRGAPSAGADEMKRADSASDAEARAAWLWKAVGKGNPQAPIELARMYERGTGVVRSCDQAEVLLRSAASKGNSQAKINLQQIRARGGCSAR